MISAAASWWCSVRTTTWNRLDDGTSVAGLTVLIATGARYRKLTVPRLEEFEGVSVFYSATPVEARACMGGPVVIVGGGNSAGQAAL